MDKYYKRTFANKKEHEGILFDSTLEYDFYLKAINSNIKLEREPETLDLIPRKKVVDFVDKYELDNDKNIRKNQRKAKTFMICGKTGTPDFKYKDIFIECKGYQFGEEGLNTRKLVYYFYPNIKLIVIQSHKDFDFYIQFLIKYKQIK